jgi:hypothetical protein
MLAMVKELNSFQGSRWNPGMAIARVGLREIRACASKFLFLRDFRAIDERSNYLAKIVTSLEVAIINDLPV